MHIAQSGVTSQPLTFHLGTMMLSPVGGGPGGSVGGGPGGSVGGGPGGGVGGGSGGGVTTGGSSGTTGGSSGGGLVPAALGFFGLLLGGLGLAASAPPPVAPTVAGGPAIVAPAPSAPAPVAAPAPGAPPGLAAPPAAAPVVLAASAAQPPVVTAASPKPGIALPYTGANFWVPVATGSGLIGLGLWLRMFGQRFREDESPQD